MMEDYLDDRVIIPDRIKKMTREELEREIAKLEAEAAENKKQIETAKPVPKAG